MGIVRLFTWITEFTEEQADEIIKYIKKVREKEIEMFLFPLESDDMLFASEEWEHWNTYEKEMPKLSNKFPNITFIIEIQHELEDNKGNDLEKLYYKNGSHVSIMGKNVKIWEKEFSPNELK